MIRSIIMTNKFRKYFSAFLALIMMFSVLADAAGAAGDARDDAPGRVWNTDIRISIMSENELMKAAKMDLASWYEAVEAQKQAGLDSAISKADMLKADGNAVILEEDGLVYQLGGSSLFGKITDALDAYRLAYRLVDMLGGSSLTALFLRSRLTMNDKTVYSFQRVCDGETVAGGMLKIALDGSGNVTAVFSYFDAEANREQTLLTKAEAEALVASQTETGTILPEYTERVFLFPYDLLNLIDIESSDTSLPKDDLVWIVYTSAEEAENAQYPYIAHYVKANGVYLRSLPVRQPGDEEAESGYRKRDVFAGMEPDTYTGEITDVNGNKRTVTIPVMRSEEDGCWYLGDLERHIVFADYCEFFYGENHDLALIKSENNADWDQFDIFAIYNFIVAWDFYADMGWKSPHGTGSDVLIFNNVRYKNGTFLGTTGFVEKTEGFDVFLYSPYNADGSPHWLTAAVDAMAHEFTHGFTSTISRNYYFNDSGAINEAMSDIFGNLVEFVSNETDDTLWWIGENTGSLIRNMSDPEQCFQPAMLWGKYYSPHADKPCVIKDYGGVHKNSSLLNYIAAMLCMEYNMSYEEAVSFWLMTSMGLTPKTDYRQICSVMDWALRETGLSAAYGEVLKELIRKTRIDSSDFPEALPEGQRLVTLDLPDTKTFQDDNWTLSALQMQPKTTEELEKALALLLADKPENGDFLFENTESLGEFEDELKRPEDIKQLYIDLFRLSYWMYELFIDDSESITSWELNDTGSVPVVLENEPTLYLLYNFNLSEMKRRKTLILLDGKWYDVTDYFNGTIDEETVGAEEFFSAMKRELKKLLNGLFEDAPAETDTSAAEKLPSAGLEAVRFVAEPSRTAWYYDGVHYVLENDIMKGVENGKFKPDRTASRAMIAQMLWNMEGCPKSAGSAGYTDVDGEKWYADPIAWVSAAGLMSGCGNGLFRPDAAISREELAAALYKFARYRGLDTDAAGDMARFPDAGEVSAWAADAMRWAVGTGLVNGTADSNGVYMIAPRGNATRAQIAVMFWRFCENAAK